MWWPIVFEGWHKNSFVVDKDMDDDASTIHGHAFALVKAMVFRVPRTRFLDLVFVSVSTGGRGDHALGMLPSSRVPRPM